MIMLIWGGREREKERERERGGGERGWKRERGIERVCVIHHKPLCVQTEPNRHKTLSFSMLSTQNPSNPITTINK